MSELKAEVAARFAAVNGDHPMTPADDAYVDEHFVALDELCAARSIPADAVRADILARRLPLPSYLRSDGTEMVPADLLEPAERAGGTERLAQWFQAHWSDPEQGAGEWQAYLSGRYVCLRSVTPDSIRRKDELTGAIGRMLGDPRPESRRWIDDLHRAVDGLDALEPPFTAYDRLRFGGPVSRDTMIDAVRARFPGAGERGATPPGRSPGGAGRTRR
ncbi:hypothetical protein HDA32_001337 [Spinactinospora alkalitolerans]|uniref:Uncharacterized protein n=1 Tax=Spinactinospora alkalitolerans TaxID=687207 RepID=A0A852TSG7_9ACTN|nr:DUF6058 family natural product biosynthesis protein [Spinactinospora alkalitolerans]NYE46217.1 hypothetical protein [Spinactinospora alkalitolerans]